MRPGLADIRGSALWHLYDLDHEQGHFDLRRVEESDYRAASFLDQRIESQCPEAYRYEIRHFGSLFPEATTDSAAHFIFHLGHCGSTLLSRALATGERVLPVREPLPLRTLADRIDEHPQDLLTVLRALNRRFHSGQRSLVKATSTCNRLIEPILHTQPESKAVLMYVRLESYLAGMLGKQAEPRDLVGHLPARLRDWNLISGAAPLKPETVSHSQARLAVLAWITSQHLMLSAAAARPGQCLLLDFEEFLSDPHTVLETVAGFLGLDVERDAILKHWPQISSAYSKLPEHPYTAANREQTLQNGRQTRAQDIRHGLDWARHLVHNLDPLEHCRPYFGES